MDIKGYILLKKGDCFCSLFVFSRRAKCAQLSWTGEWNTGWCYMWKIVSYLNGWYLEKRGFCPAVDKVMVKFTLEQAKKPQRESGSVVLPPGKSVPFVLHAGYNSETVCTGEEKIAPKSIRSLELPACSQSLYWLNYPGSTSIGMLVFFMWFLSK